MKKVIAAGSAIALAALPMAGVFAVDDDTSIHDTLHITVNATCTFDTENSGSVTDTTYSATVANDAVAAFDNGSAHVFDVTCNDNEGWSVTASAPLALTATGSTHSIAYQASALPAADSGTDEGVWNAIVSGAGVSAENAGITPSSNVNYINTAGGIIATENASTDGSTFTVTYGAYVGDKTAAGTYTATTSAAGGTIDYTLAQL